MISALTELPAPVFLVLDDVHELENPSIGSALSYLATRTPTTLRLVFSGRFLPGIPLGRMRVLGEVLEIRTKDLAFTEDELRTVLHSSQREASPDEVRELINRTEGWPAGVRLAELSIELGTEKDTIADLTGKESIVADYLLSEVFNLQESHVQEFLLLTCVADSLTADLANALTGRTDSAQLLDSMAETNAFVALQGRLPWYRYHQLFAETLRHKLARDRVPHEYRIEALTCGFARSSMRPRIR
jgi:LuxR family maltose regulon positive regulatory protein